MKYARMLVVLVAFSAVLTIALFYQNLRDAQSQPGSPLVISSPFKLRAATARVVNTPVYLTATLVNAEEKAKDQIVTVLVKVRGLTLVDDLSNASGPERHGQLLYRLDDRSTIATSATRISFRDLEPGEHAIYVSVIGSDEEPIGVEETLRITVPEPTSTAGLKIAE